MIHAAILCMCHVRYMLYHTDCARRSDTQAAILTHLHGSQKVVLEPAITLNFMYSKPAIRSWPHNCTACSSCDRLLFTTRPQALPSKLSNTRYPARGSSGISGGAQPASFLARFHLRIARMNGRLQTHVTWLGLEHYLQSS